jgi:hypothetical protein
MFFLHVFTFLRDRTNRACQQPYRININNVISIKTPDNASIAIRRLRVGGDKTAAKRGERKGGALGFNTL